MIPIARAAFLLISIFAMASCVTGKKKLVTPEPPPPRIIGKVALVNEDDRFVLIDAAELVPAGTPLTTLSPAGETTGEVKVSLERRQPFLIGDITQGNPATGDQVLHRPKGDVSAVPKETPAP